MLSGSLSDEECGVSPVGGPEASGGGRSLSFIRGGKVPWNAVEVIPPGGIISDGLGKGGIVLGCSRPR